MVHHEVLYVIHYYSIMRTTLERSQVYSENIIIINVLKKDLAETSETITPFRHFVLAISAMLLLCI